MTIFSMRFFLYSCVWMVDSNASIRVPWEDSIDNNFSWWLRFDQMIQCSKCITRLVSTLHCLKNHQRIKISSGSNDVQPAKEFCWSILLIFRWLNFRCWKLYDLISLCKYLLRKFLEVAILYARHWNILDDVCQTDYTEEITKLNHMFKHFI